MTGFLLRKTAYDLWDNMFRIVLVNLGFIVLLVIPAYLPELLGRKLFNSDVIVVVVRAAGILCCSVYLSTAAFSIKTISDYGSFGFGDFFCNLKQAWPAGLVAGLLFFGCLSVALIAIPFYMSMDSPVGLLLAALIFWALIFAVLSFQFFFAVRARLDTKLLKVFKKCILLFVDNPGMAIFSLLHNTAMLIVSLLLAFLFPGPAGILLYLDEALRLRIMKYDWLEVNPDANRRKIPWDELLMEEREKTGTRTLKNFIFPWKD
ncbi:MAG: hypothetical protein FWG99_09390 [Treponema sp.]|nr:hypothetical protein [Treponema sp.]